MYIITFRPTRQRFPYLAHSLHLEEGIIDFSMYITFIAKQYLGQHPELGMIQASGILLLGGSANPTSDFFMDQISVWGYLVFFLPAFSCCSSFKPFSSAKRF